ncbi:hypothetical protein MJO28_010147 [Puccinia striiformis f. sp. tritici]|uniref:Uncharacterized protein n=1 Tax=Puccinia striiformis f. sp. tritici TaxID=168172 RepID=A0ACC0E435_9BASI|nr:hypothetical protein MJO28_010147 [Puccinia striiformis f. sp. tritici]
MTDADISEEDGYASSDWEPRENVKPRFYIPSEPSSALLNGANITEDSCHIAEEDGYASSDWEPRENVKPRFYIPSKPSSALLDGANITEDSCHIAEEDRYASSDWEPRENVKPRFYIPSEPSSALINGTNIADNVDPFANGSPEGLAYIDPNRQFEFDTHGMKSQQSVCVILKGFPYSTTETDIQVHLRELGVQPDRIVICMDEHQHSCRFGFVTFPNVEVASQLVDTHFPGIQWPVPGGVDNTIEVLIDYSTPSERPSKRHHKLDSDMEPHILKKQCVSPTQGGTTAGPSTIRLVPPAPSSPRPITGANSNRLPSRDVDAVNQTRYPCQDCGINYPSEERLANHLTKSSHKEKVESNNSKGKARG